LVPDLHAVIIDPAFLGDTVFDGPLARALKRRHPAGRVGLVVRPPSDRIARRLLHVDRVHVFDKRGADRGWRGLKRLAAELAAEGYQEAYIPHPSLRSVLLARLAGIPRRVGATQGTFAGLWLTERHPSTGTFVTDRLGLLGPDVQGVDLQSLSGLMRRPPPDPTSGPQRIGLCLGSEWATKRWPIARVAELCRALDPSRHRLVLLGAPWESPLFQALREAAPEALASAEDQTQGDLDGLIDALGTCRVVLGGDTGPVHLARALGIPVVALFGPTSEARHAFEAQDQVLFERIDCRPCSPHGHDRCPLGHHRCLVDLSGERVRGAVIRALEHANPARGDRV
jgi:heptosyltransferase-2